MHRKNFHSHVEKTGIGDKEVQGFFLSLAQNFLELLEGLIKRANRDSDGGQLTSAHPLGLGWIWSERKDLAAVEISGEKYDEFQLPSTT